MNLPTWACNVLGIYNIHESGPYSYWYNFLTSNIQQLDGDVVEIGVFKGRTFCSTCSVLAQSAPNKVVWGFDSFSGFPNVNHPFDQIDRFKFLFLNGYISQAHYDSHLFNLELLSVLGKPLDVQYLSSSLNFSATSEDLVRRKLSYLNLENFKLIKGDVSSTIYIDPLPDLIAAVFLDADMYEPYLHTLSSLWSRLVSGGLIFLDEYYSLKFPGPRFAVDEFLKLNKDGKLICIEKNTHNFERWILQKI